MECHCWSIRSTFLGISSSCTYSLSWHPPNPHQAQNSPSLGCRRQRLGGFVIVLRLSLAAASMIVPYFRIPCNYNSPHRTLEGESTHSTSSNSETFCSYNPRFSIVRFFRLSTWFTSLPKCVLGSALGDFSVALWGVRPPSPHSIVPELLRFPYPRYCRQLPRGAVELILHFLSYWSRFVRTCYQCRSPC